MAEEESGASSRYAPDSLATAFALGGASREKADALLTKQSALIDLQIEDLKREDAIRHWSLRVHHISDVLKLTFELALALILGAIVLVIGATAWSAAHENGLVIEAFSVPPDMAQQGLTGQAIAAKLQDKLAAMQAATDSARPAASYSNNWGNDIKVQIPDTGVSIGEFYRMLTLWLGHQSHITGEVYRTKSGLSISARASGDGGGTVTGQEGDLDGLVQKAAETIYADTQPYRYAAYLGDTRRWDAARATYDRLIVEGATARERAWAYVGRGIAAQFAGDPYRAVPYYRKAVTLVPGFALALADLEFSAAAIGHDEEGLAASRTVVPLLEGDADVDMTPRARMIVVPEEEADLAGYLDAFSDALKANEDAAALPDYAHTVEGSREGIVGDLAHMHDPGAAFGALRDLPPSQDPNDAYTRRLQEMLVDFAREDWRDVLQVGRWLVADNKEAHKAHIYAPGIFASPPPTQVVPYMAYAAAATRDWRGAAQLIALTPLDCALCLRMRGRIAALHGDANGANSWFERATAFAPSIPMGWSNWGEMLLRRGDLDGAIAKFEIANRKGPHFADPLELWGEALIAKNRSDLALAKFREASDYAPHWGRLHLKWGEALLWTGDREGAKKQFAIAKALSLTGAEQSELVRMEAHE